MDCNQPINHAFFLLQAQRSREYRSNSTTTPPGSAGSHPFHPTARTACNPAISMERTYPASEVKTPTFSAGHFYTLRCGLAFSSRPAACSSSTAQCCAPKNAWTNTWYPPRATAAAAIPNGSGNKNKTAKIAERSQHRGYITWGPFSLRGFSPPSRGFFSSHNRRNR